MALSFSKYSTWEKCAAKYKFRYVDKLEEPKGDAMSRGSEVHSTVEAYLLGQTEMMHPDIHSYYGQFMFNLRNANVKVETKIAVDRDWKIVDWDSPDAHIRSVIDAHVPPREDGRVLTFEWKTGKMYPEHYNQRELYAVKLKCMYPTAEWIEVTGVYFDLRKNSSPYLHPAYYQEPKVELWDARFNKLLRDEEFIPNPSYACRWCHFRKDNGGPCEF